MGVSRKKICLVQITRIGDLIQTASALKEFNRDDVELLLIARIQFAGPIDFLLEEIFDKIIFLDTKSIVDFNKPNKNNSLKKLDKFLEKINEEEIDTLVNLSYSKSSSLLCSLIDAKVKQGPWYGDKMELFISDKWSQYLYSCVLQGPLCSFSLIDIYKKILGQTTTNILQTKFTPGENIILHPFASLARKMWKPHKWVDIIYRILKDHPEKKIILMGDESETKKAKEIADHFILKPFKKRLIDKTGKMILLEVSRLVKKSFLFIGHDSMIGHMAAYYGLPSLTVSLGSVRPLETSPYTDKAYVLSPRTKCFPCFPRTQCDLYQCHHDIPPQIVGMAVKLLIEEGTITLDRLKEKSSHFHLASVDIYEGRFSSQNMHFLKPLTNHEYQLNDVFRAYYRIAWLYYLEEIEEHQDIFPLSTLAKEQLIQYQKGLDYFKELLNFHKKYAQSILEEMTKGPQGFEKIKELSEKMKETDELISSIRDNFPHLYPLIDYFTLIKGNIPGDNLAQITENYFLSCHSCSLIVDVFKELIGQSLGQQNVTREITK